MTDHAWTFKPVAPEDIIGALNTIEGEADYLVDLAAGWTPADRYLHWSRSGLADDDDPELGSEVALTFAKRAVCQRIAAFLLNSYLGRFERLKYPAKIDLLKELGLSGPGIGYRWVIAGRNEVEHHYQPADRQQAEEAMEVAELF